MSTQTVTGRQQPTSEFVLIDPVTGLAMGGSGQPLQTATSALQTTADLTKTIVAPIVTATTTNLTSATASQKTRVYRLRLDVAGANVITITDASGSEKMNFTGAGFKILDFATRPWYTTATNVALTMTTTTTAEVNVTVEFTKVA